jgi:hypothetical protein
VSGEAAAQSDRERERRVAARADLGELLLRTTNLTESQLEAARGEQTEHGGRLIDHLVAAGHVSADQVMQVLGAQLGLPIRAQIVAGDVDEGLIERLPITFVKEHGVMPLQREPSWSTSARCWARSTRPTIAGRAPRTRWPRTPPTT